MISAVDWCIVAAYLLGMVLFGLWLARKTATRAERWRYAGLDLATLLIFACCLGLGHLLGAA